MSLEPQVGRKAMKGMKKCEETPQGANVVILKDKYLRN